MAHVFADSLAASAAFADAPWWTKTYHRAFPDLRSSVIVRTDGWAQRGGIDRVLTLASGRQVTIDEKVRSKDFGDFLLERWSNYEKKVDGWVCKPLACDYIAYAVIPTETCYLFPTLELQRAWSLRHDLWGSLAKTRRDGFRVIQADNGTYTTISIAVPKAALISAIADAMVISWAEVAA